MKVKIMGLEIDENISIRELQKILNTHIISINREPTAKEIIDTC